MDIKEKIKDFPQSPGIYMMRDDKGNIIIDKNSAVGILDNYNNYRYRVRCTYFRVRKNTRNKTYVQHVNEKI